MSAIGGPCPTCGCTLYRESGPCEGHNIADKVGLLAMTLDAKDLAYRERNRLVALLAALYPSSLVAHDERQGQAWAEEWKYVILIELPTGQISFHVRSDELMEIFGHVRIDTTKKWDGHTNEQKWGRIESLAARIAALSD